MRKISIDILRYMLNTSFSHDIILIEGHFSQFSVVLCSELKVDICLCDLLNLSSHENAHYVGFCN